MTTEVQTALDELEEYMDFNDLHICYDASDPNSEPDYRNQGHRLAEIYADMKSGGGTCVNNEAMLLDRLEDCAGVLQSIEDQLKGKCHAVKAALANARSAIAKVKK